MTTTRMLSVTGHIQGQGEMAKVSVIIPARNEIFLGKTIADLLAKAGGDVEVVAVLDGYWPDPVLPDDPRLVLIHRSTPRGMRDGINSAAAVAKGEYLMKVDAHCMFAEGYDLTLQADCADNWVVIPRRYSLDAEAWKIDDNGKPPRDYHYICFPHWDKDHDAGMHGVEWWARGKERADSRYDIDETMSFQGSCWFMTRRHWQRLGGMSEIGYGTFTQEPQEIGNKTWLGGGAVMTNKKTWYAHLHKGSRYGRMWRMGRIDEELIRQGHAYSANYWMTNAWPERVHDFEWFIGRFSPVPSWGEDWPGMFRAWREHYGVQ